MTFTRASRPGSPPPTRRYVYVTNTNRLCRQIVAVQVFEEKNLIAENRGLILRHQAAVLTESLNKKSNLLLISF